MNNTKSKFKKCHNISCAEELRSLKREIGIYKETLFAVRMIANLEGEQTYVDAVDEALGVKL